MIILAQRQKDDIVNQYIEKNGIEWVVVLGDPLEYLIIEPYYVSFKEVIMYKHFYPLLQKINNKTLIVINECLKKTNRYCLEYNCIRHYLQNTEHRIIFNFYPIIEKEEDFAILMDFQEKNPFLKTPYKDMTDFSKVYGNWYDWDFEIKTCELSDKAVTQYAALKEKTIGEVKKDPDIIPRRLLKFAEQVKKKEYPQFNFDTLAEKTHKKKILLSQLKVDEWYYNDLLRWKEGVINVYYKIYNY